MVWKLNRSFLRALLISSLSHNCFTVVAKIIHKICIYIYSELHVWYQSFGHQNSNRPPVFWFMCKEMWPIKIRNRNILDTCQNHTILAFQYVASMQPVTLSDMHFSMDRLATCCLTFNIGMCCKYMNVVITCVSMCKKMLMLSNTSLLLSLEFLDLDNNKVVTVNRGRKWLHGCDTHRSAVHQPKIIQYLEYHSTTYSPRFANYPSV